MEQLLQQLIEFVKSASPYVWGILVKQSYVEGISNTILFVVSVIVCLVLVKIIRYVQKKLDDNDFDDSYGPMIIFGSIVVIVILFVVGITSMITAVMYFLNPEYYAITNIIQLLKK